MQTWHLSLFMTCDADPTSFRGSGYIDKTNGCSGGDELLFFSLLDPAHDEYSIRF